MARKSLTAGDVQLFEDGQVLKVLVGDDRDGNVGDLDLVLAHQVEQEVHRASKDVQVHAEIGHSINLPERAGVGEWSGDQDVG